MNSAKCPACNQLIHNVHFEEHVPSGLKGGSLTYTATVYPCGHAIGAVPATWEGMLGGIQKQNKELIHKVEAIEDNLSRVISLLNQIALRK